ncbi:MAG: hypothetical protein COA58_11725 [Bacteroidetes bacterium]|nr:MAG: hypothetical protein COA58_11725 [Bacteroidota bacterium]
MKTILTSLLTLFFCSNICAQDPYGTPLSEVKQMLSDHPSLYDSLRTQLFAGDSLGGGDLFTIYYGVAYQDNYSPYGQGSEIKIISELLDEKEYNKAAQEGVKLIESSALNLKAILYTAYSYRMADDSLSSAKYYKMYYSIFSIPYNSGDGESEESAFVVSSVQDEYLIIDKLDGKFSGQALVSKNGSSYDVMTLKIDDEEKQLYFNIDQPFGIGLAGMFKDTKSSKKKKRRERRK